MLLESAANVPTVAPTDCSSVVYAWCWEIGRRKSNPEERKAEQFGIEGGVKRRGRCGRKGKRYAMTERRVSSDDGTNSVDSSKNTVLACHAYRVTCKFVRCNG